jgi:asparagine synthase (glutamine-hydrolysing)
MCGINGLYSSRNINFPALIGKMNDAISHRGPNSAGDFQHGKVALGHRRLSIIDLSDAGTQPFFSEDGRLAIVFNGEIYNFKELKAEIGEHNYQSGTDTEVLLVAYQKWGKDCLQKLNGMFAFAIYDKETEEIFIARDRIGIKPLYYYKTDSQFLFSSEIRGLLASKLVPRKLDKNSLADYLRYQTVHAPNTILQNVSVLPSGSFMLFKNGEFSIHNYWNPQSNQRKDLPKSYEAVKGLVKDEFYKAVERRLVADVPFGAFLSGGIDSSAIVGAMSQISNTQTKTFSVTFDEAEFSEAKYAQIIAKKFNADHHEIKLTPESFLEEIPLALNAIDHPSGDGPNSFIVSKVTKEAGVTMALSGLGGDELFAGYDVFKRLPSLASKNWITNFPKPMRQLAGFGLRKMKPSVASSKISELLESDNFGLSNTYPITRQVLLDDSIRQLLTNKQLPKNAVQALVEKLNFNGDLPFLSQISILEMQSYMQNVLLRDTDQMSMASALEVRVPFLDHELVELALGISDSHKFPHSPKRLLIESLGDLLPSEVVNRPKMGFVLPWADWLKNEMKSMAETSINNLAKRDIFEGDELKKLWNEFLIGNPSVTWSRLWPLIVLENWMEKHGIEA